MSDLLTAAQMRAIEQAAIESGDVTGLELMERAGQGVVEAIFEEWPELDEAGDVAGGQPPDPRGISGNRKRAVVLCGPGNNGGDGFVVARLLQGRGWEVEVFLYGDAEKLPPDAKVNYERWLQIGAVAEYTSKLHMHVLKGDFDLVVDALLGTGASRALDGVLGNTLTVLSASMSGKERKHKRVAIDNPTGTNSDTGVQLDFDHVEWTGFDADLTVTFHRSKVGHWLDFAADVCGKIIVKDIGLEAKPLTKAGKSSLAVPVDERVWLLDGPTRSLGKHVGHKYSHGHALILTGGSGKTGAARLAARGALRVGAGLVTLGVPPSAQQEVACQITALMLTRVGDATALDVILGDNRLNALCLGPGMGLERARDLAPVALAAKRATVLDADALSAFADDPEALFQMLHENCVLTPHGGEFAKLFPDVGAKLAAVPTKGPAYSKVDATREAAARAGCIVLYKGADTVIAAPDGRCSVNAAVYERAAPWLATAGSGDVLAGFITGLLARGFAPMAAAETGAWLHVESARAFGPGLIAEDLPEMLPQVLRALAPEG
ncbi:NAD(P)H-hydrate dehydratase [Shimia haliotis]|uniref:Bifunctional NAD(P)H-hydrate repair enzyme n=1 Tax=Shimia haliotis TaxID=1280847 RepID=A0A1I4BG19_9RHOB|nr:NAD(P)H-hydrate dehydratase [Shimia haliotis]SFK67443.1 yjeF C-terminal region, hydroxyethylthiazole kinase-related/yjeF N-terminal region [Shimia haliotis]